VGIREVISIWDRGKLPAKKKEEEQKQSYVRRQKE
jgi:hypothetical protein